MKKIRGVGSNSYTAKKIRALNKMLAPPKLAGVGLKPIYRKGGRKY